MFRRNGADSEKAKINKCGEYYNIAKKINNLFITCSAAPQLLINYLSFDDKTLTEEADKMLPQSLITDYLLPWAELLQRNEVPFDKVHLLFYSLLCKIKMPFLSLQDQCLLAQVQIAASHRNLIPKMNENKELRDGLHTLTTFFASEYEKHFVTILL